MIEENQTHEKPLILEAYRKELTIQEQNDLDREKVRKIALEIIANKGFVLATDISERLDIPSSSAAHTLSHNYKKKWNLVKGRIIIGAAGDSERMGYSDKIEKIPKTLTTTKSTLRKEIPEAPKQIKDFRKSEIPPKVLELIRKQEENSRKGIRMHR